MALSRPVTAAAACAALLLIAAPRPAGAQDRRLPSPGESGRRLALVVGNDAYPGMKLSNAVNDARAMGAALRALGFAVTVVENATLKRFRDEVDAFAGRVESGDVAAFYFAGHGVEVDARNWLIPVDFQATQKADVPYSAYAAQQVRDKLREKGARLRLMILDACRNDPFERSGAGGLGKMPAAVGEYILFAAAPGQTAADSPGALNGLFTGHMVEALKAPGLKLQDAFKRAQQAVYEASKGRQFPYAEDGVVGDVYLASAAAAASAGAPPAPLPALPAPPTGGGVDLAALEARAKLEQQWGDYQTKLKGEFQRVSNLGGSPSLQASAWESWLSSYSTDNPLSREDDDLRSVARTRLATARSEAAAQVVIPPSTAATSPSGPSGDAWVNPKDGLRYRRIPAGTFQMGCVPNQWACSSDETRRLVTLPEFWLGETEVTVGAYRRFKAAPRGNDAGEDHPVVGMSWYEARDFCEWGGGRLPSEEEWERAARGGIEAALYPWGNSVTHEEANYGAEEKKGRLEGGLTSGRDLWERTAPVASFAPNGYGLYDVAGNVRELTSTAEGPRKNHYSRGGSWDSDSYGLRVFGRRWFVGPTLRSDVGFRCARDAV